jgi:hypothetical protein
MSQSDIPPFLFDRYGTVLSMPPPLILFWPGPEITLPSVFLVPSFPEFPQLHKPSFLFSSKL